MQGGCVRMCVYAYMCMYILLCHTNLICVVDTSEYIGHCGDEPENYVAFTLHNLQYQNIIFHSFIHSSKPNT